MKKLHFLLYFLLFLTGCVKTNWVETTNRVYIYGDFSNTSNLIWEGNTSGPLADGQGVLVSLNSNGSVKSRTSYHTTLGVVDGFQYVPTPYGDYLGETDDDIPSGFGVLMLNDTLLIGNFKKGKLSGQSQVYTNNKSSISPLYIGQMKMGIPNGIGKQYIDDMISFEGSYDSGLKDGLGNEYKSGELIYSGEFKNDLRHGEGKEYIDGNMVYDGEWNKGLRHGKGVEYNSKGLLLYSGSWKNNKYNGKGLLYKEGECIEGKWENGRLVRSISTSVFDQIGNATKKILSDPDSLNIRSIDELKKREYPASQLQFIEQLHIDIEKYIAKDVEKRVSKRFGFWNLFRMLIQPWIKSDVNRAENAENFFVKNIKEDKIQNLINSKIDFYNADTNFGNLQYVKLEKIPEGSIITNDVAIKIFEREALEISDVFIGFLIDILLCFVIAFIIGFIIGMFIPGLIPYVGIVDTIMFIVSIVVGLYISIFRTTVISVELEKHISELIVNNYMQFLESQNIIIQIIGI